NARRGAGAAQEGGPRVAGPTLAVIEHQSRIPRPHRIRPARIPRGQEALVRSDEEGSEGNAVTAPPKCATGSASAGSGITVSRVAGLAGCLWSLGTTERHWQSQWHTDRLPVPPR